MQLDCATEALITFEVFPEGYDPPRRGDAYHDPRGRTWTVREVRPARGYVLRDPNPGVEGYRVTLQPDFALHTIAVGEVLTPIEGIRCSGANWSGRIRRHTTPIQGFGEVRKDDVDYSWLLRVLDGEACVRIGSRVAYENYFAGGLHEVTVRAPDVGALVPFVHNVLEQWVGAAPTDPLAEPNRR